MITTEDARAGALPAPGQSITAVPAAAPKPATAPAAGSPPAGKTSVVTPIDPALKYQQEVAKLRVKLRDLQDQETALQLQLNDFTNKFNAPVTDTASRADAQARLGEAQNRLSTVRGDLDVTRKALATMEQ